MSGAFSGPSTGTHIRSRSPATRTLLCRSRACLAGGRWRGPYRIYLLGCSWRLPELPSCDGASRLFAVAHVSGASVSVPGYGLGRCFAKDPHGSLDRNERQPSPERTRVTRYASYAEGFEVRYAELAGVGHCCPFRNRATDVLAWFLDHRLDHSHSHTATKPTTHDLSGLEADLRITDLG